jgi:hydrogenase maturation factor
VNSLFTCRGLSAVKKSGDEMEKKFKAHEMYAATANELTKKLVNPKDEVLIDTF